MARRRYDEDDDLGGPLPRALERLGQGLLLAAAGLVIGAVFSMSAGGVWYGAALGTLGLASRAAACVLSAHAHEGEQYASPVSCPGRDGRSPATEQELVQLFEREQAKEKPHFVARLEDEQRRTGAGKGI